MAKPQPRTAALIFHGNQQVVGSNTVCALCVCVCVCVCACACACVCVRVCVYVCVCERERGRVCPARVCSYLIPPTSVRVDNPNVPSVRANTSVFFSVLLSYTMYR